MIRKAVGAIVTYGNQFMLVNKVKINVRGEKEHIKSEWDFVKGGVEPFDHDLKATAFRELEEETGSGKFIFKKQFEEKICFEFPPAIQEKIGYSSQETTMFHFEYVGKQKSLKPQDNEISEIRFIDKAYLNEFLTHEDTQKFFIKHFT